MLRYEPNTLTKTHIPDPLPSLEPTDEPNTEPVFPEGDNLPPLQILNLLPVVCSSVCELPVLSFLKGLGPLCSVCLSPPKNRANLLLAAD
ncbi:hypothetical protein TREMEDRAFT_71949 [Tremella mesenterica DSM 1558]|uniref:uncharacterized protein n=1 Tax=Tremella mesenterica (strain ATCC 24925 / CBS 8224 / DSM 1558 / NBRC 9311 / NRRL Y-6157 / RJB 2259-6 / UBC 559-6) TaxID=578456 RepID=UPI0003F48BFA|nr:uncharacterized protein TREMEDRAFT_71949 [Tremella mesenterica DSM 1558]EIW68260.1 hypothetical protein TREMEDRAFT_71949 [Tremella mesenterica DSM 1558]